MVCGFGTAEHMPPPPPPPFVHLSNPLQSTPAILLGHKGETMKLVVVAFAALALQNTCHHCHLSSTFQESYTESLNQPSSMKCLCLVVPPRGVSCSTPGQVQTCPKRTILNANNANGQLISPVLVGSTSNTYVIIITSGQRRESTQSGLL